jgi:Flp pilus assembly protein TadG
MGTQLDPKTVEKGRRELRGTSLLTVLFALVALIAAASLSIDVGVIWLARTQAQNASDAAALAAAATMIDTTGPSVTIPAAETSATSIAGNNWAVANASVVVDPADITFGNWDLTTRTFDAGVDQSDPYQVTAVDVVARLDGVTNGPVPAFMSRVLGRQDFDVVSRSTAYLGFAGSFGPGEIDLPVAIDCCKLRGSDCQQDYCATVASPPNACDLDVFQDEGSNTVSCLEFHNTAEQNACWTQFDGDSSSINTAELRDIVEEGSTVEIDVPWPAYVDNGDKTPVIGEIRDRFMGEGGYVGNGEGTDFYADSVGGSTPDSWVVRLPVINCQTDDHCAGGAPAIIIGAVCFEIREIVVTPDKIIRGTFMCPGHPRWADCEINGTGGGGDFGIIAEIPVLVR